LVGQIQQQTAAQTAGDATRNDKPVTPAPNGGGGTGINSNVTQAERDRLKNMAGESSFLNRIRGQL
jgi:hypothetical protein